MTALEACLAGDGPAWTGRGRPAAGFYTRRLAQEWLDAVLVRARAGTLPGAVRTGATFVDACAEYLRFIVVFHALMERARRVCKLDANPVRDNDRPRTTASAGVRSVPLAPAAAGALARLSQREHRAGDDDLVFPGINGTYLDASALLNATSARCAPRPTAARRSGSGAVPPRSRPRQADSPVCRPLPPPARSGRQ